MLSLWCHLASVLCFSFTSASLLPEFSPLSNVPSNEGSYRLRQPNRYETAAKDYSDSDYDVDVPGNTIPGVPERDFPIYHEVPETRFSCPGGMPGFFADEETRCQVWHYCRSGGKIDSFLCPNGTIYNQKNRVCEWWFNVRCEETEAAFHVNEDLYIIPPPTPTPEFYGSK